MFSRIRAFVTVVQFVITVLMTIVLMYTFKKHHRTIRKKWARMQHYLMGFNIVEKGTFNPEAKLMLINHQSLVDIVAMESIHPMDPCWVTKKELQDIPLFGHIVRAPDMIPIDRSDRRSLIKLLVDVKDRLAKGRIIALFPEGTRGKGDKLLKFQSGAKVLAEKLDLKVQPIIITGSRYVLDSQKLTAHSGTVTVTYLDMIDPKKDENWYETLKETMAKALTDELANNPSHR